eukprot:CAMPEP_0176142068 /NCGR_PEP_ID=MMETSP0120_2-20121206/72265_1 /TAXON_ID=160619 /ORGANISM="Kryptoperidinium foliaceum, Strain CCMP 1326" /LENGTH=218 /DNA_ID=CAMNT_0017478263 /DNA_START=321 /DNA_END=975 /DNA_ORIENTATION=+
MARAVLAALLCLALAADVALGGDAPEFEQPGDISSLLSVAAAAGPRRLFTDTKWGAWPEFAQVYGKEFLGTWSSADKKSAWTFMREGDKMMAKCTHAANKKAEALPEEDDAKWQVSELEPLGGERGIYFMGPVTVADGTYAGRALRFRLASVDGSYILTKEAQLDHSNFWEGLTNYTLFEGGKKDANILTQNGEPSAGAPIMRERRGRIPMSWQGIVR